MSNVHHNLATDIASSHQQRSLVVLGLKLQQLRLLVVAAEHFDLAVKLLEVR